MRVYVRTNPRTIYIASSRHCLSIRSTEPSGPVEQRLKCVAEFLPQSEIDLERCVRLPINCFGCLGLINVDSDVFLGVISSREKAATPSPEHTVWKILNVEFICLRLGVWDFTGAGGADADVEIAEHPCAPLRKFLSGGGFYYSTDFDLTSMIQNFGPESELKNHEAIVDASFMWNKHMLDELSKLRSRLSTEDRMALESGGFLSCMIRGFAGTSKFELDSPDKTWGLLTVISRQSWLKAGTRYNSRGIDDDGNVANFVETETVMWLSNGVQFGYTQLRGSVPVFWEQDANLLGAKLLVTRSQEASQPAFDKHFDSLLTRFGAVHCLNLLGTSGNEDELTQRYRGHIRNKMARDSETIRYTHFDFHHEVSGGAGYGAASRLIEKVQDSMLEYGFYSHNPLHSTSEAETQQVGVFRTNCLDCLDRTNLIQQLLSKDALDLFLDYYQMYATDDLWTTHAMLWADNGDQLSRNYAGTGALKSSFTRSGRMSLAGALSDGIKSVNRLYVNNFVDKQRQATIDLLLGRGEGQLQVTIYDPINDYVREQMKRLVSDYSTSKTISVFCGTFNVNGKYCGEGDDLSAWLFPPEMRHPPDLYMLGFQELVELTTSQILSVDSTRRSYWEDRVQQTLDRHGNHYVLLRSGQLVGTAIMLFVKRSQMHNVTHVEGTSKKTAFGGMTGNKGGIAVGFRYANTQFMFINSHLAAGMNNVEERHQDFKLLNGGLQLSRGRRVKDMDTVLWLGDFNYRVDLPNDTVRKLIENNPPREAIQRLLEHDQLNSQMELGETFPYYQEAEITFLPTYKFDPGTYHYDTTEKARTPAWTDRILVKGPNVHMHDPERPVIYNSAPSIKFSDHRPVYALYPVSVAVVDEKKSERLFAELYENRRRDLSAGQADRNSLISVSSSESESGGSSSRLPHPSTDARKWWAGEGMPTRVPVVPPRPNMVLNPQKVNPFGQQNIPDFIDRSAVKAAPPPPPPRSSGSPVTRKPSPAVSSTSTSSKTGSGSGISRTSSLLDDDGDANIPFKSLV